jgi:hypothetical protein
MVVLRTRLASRHRTRPGEQQQFWSDSIQQFAQLLARFEERNSLRRHFNVRTGLGIASLATAPLARVEGAESTNPHLLAGPQCPNDAVQYRANNEIRLLQWHSMDWQTASVRSVLVIRSTLIASRKRVSQCSFVPLTLASPGWSGPTERSGISESTRAGIRGGRHPATFE